MENDNVIYKMFINSKDIRELDCESCSILRWYAFK